MKPIFPINEKYPVIIINRIAVFFFLMGLLSGFFYILVTSQGFLDETQLVLLRFAAFFGFMLIITAIIGFILDLIVFIKKRKIRYLLGCFLFIFFIACGAVMAYAAYFIIIFSEGNVVH